MVGWRRHADVFEQADNRSAAVSADLQKGRCADVDYCVRDGAAWAGWSVQAVCVWSVEADERRLKALKGDNVAKRGLFEDLFEAVVADDRGKAKQLLKKEPALATEL